MRYLESQIVNKLSTKPFRDSPPEVIVMDRIGIIGFGNMGQAIAGQLKGKYPLKVFDRDKEKTRNLSGIGTARDCAELTLESEVILH